MPELTATSRAAARWEGAGVGAAFWADGGAGCWAPAGPSESTSAARGAARRRKIDMREGSRR